MAPGAQPTLIPVTPPAFVEIEPFSLEQQCHAFLTHGLAPSTYKTYATTQMKVLHILSSAGPVSSLWVTLSH